MARVTNTNKWVVGGEGELRDLFVVPPLIKLAIDAIVWLIKKGKLALLSAVLFVYSYATHNWYYALVTLFMALILTALLKMGIHELRLAISTKRFSMATMNTDDPVVPLDMTGNPKSGIMLNRSILIGGESGSGKSNIVWKIIQGLNEHKIPYRLNVLDPAGGVELADLRDSAKTISYTDRPSHADGVIREFHRDMNRRFDEMRSRGIRKHVPTEDSPWRFLVVDELLLCTQALSQGISGPLGEILAVGRKAGFLVLACTQLGQKTELGPIRDLFPQRICFATRSRQMTDAILGTGATEEGAIAHMIKEPGKGFVYSQKPFISRAPQYAYFNAPLITDTKTISNPTGVDKTFKINNTTPEIVESISLRKRRTALYKFYSHDDIYLYAGIAYNPQKRANQHKKDKVWWEDVDTTKTNITWFDTRELALQAEFETITQDKPLWNVVHNNGSKWADDDEEDAIKTEED